MKVFQAEHIKGPEEYDRYVFVGIFTSKEKALNGCKEHNSIYYSRTNKVFDESNYEISEIELDTVYIG